MPLYSNIINNKIYKCTAITVFLSNITDKTIQICIEKKYLLFKLVDIQF